MKYLKWKYKYRGFTAPLPPVNTIEKFKSDTVNKLAKKGYVISKNDIEHEHFENTEIKQVEHHFKYDKKDPSVMFDPGTITLITALITAVAGIITEWLKNQAPSTFKNETYDHKITEYDPETGEEKEISTSKTGKGLLFLLPALAFLFKK